MSEFNSDFIKALTSPDRRYGEVPFYWWNGSPLEKDRIKEQIRMLAEKSVAGIQINYAHINGGGEENLPHGGHGKSIPGSPEQFSEEWWDFFSFAAKECEKYDMGIGMGDYTIAWIGNGYFTDKVSSLPRMHAKVLSAEKRMLFSGDESCADDSVLAIITYEEQNFNRPVIIYEKGKGIVTPIKGLCEAFIIHTEEKDNSIDPMNPQSGKALTDLYFREFERRVPDVKSGTLNYFFQDELMFGADTKYLWSDSLREGIREKYSYDILGFLPHLFYNLSDLTPKIRLDTADVKTQLIEECYFIPIYDFHASRGMIYGCDQSGRGTDPGEFSDYFRTCRWFTAPGNDTPGRAADLIKVKVNSSIAHLYNRPRVWLEAYHSSGWGTTLESITAPTSDNFIFGANLLNLHGLYYSTNGGFFEWAPPDFHFRMPYWDDEKQWLTKYKRMASILTTGAHCCDAAVYYPVSSHDYGENQKECTDATFGLSSYLFSQGLDFDFIDFQSVEKADCANGRLITENESYKALIFAGVDCIRYSAIKKARELLSCGGSVIFFGITPYASDRMGKNDKVLIDDINEILSHPNACLVGTYEEALNFINSHITRSFYPDDTDMGEKVYVHARVNGSEKLFFVRYAKKDSVCRFDSDKTPYILNPDTGEISLLTGTVSLDGFTFIKMPFDMNTDTLILFTDKELLCDKEINTSGFFNEKLINTTELDGFWDFSLIPTLDNTYGDFYIPKGGFIGAEARFFDIKRADKDISQYEFIDMPYCTSRAIKTVYCKDKSTEELSCYLDKNRSLIEENSFFLEDSEYTFEDRLIHSRYGYICTDDYVSSLHEQGHHGLKGKIYDDNIYFTENAVAVTYVFSPSDTSAVLSFGSIKPDFVLLNSEKVTEGEISLNKGKNLLIMSFSYDKELCPDYRNRGHIKRTSVHVTTASTEKTDYPLSVPSFANNDYMKLSGNSDISDSFTFRFTSAPALSSFEITVFGTLISAYNNGEKAEITKTGSGNFGSNTYRVNISNISPDISDVEFTVRAQNGYEYAEIIPEPVKLTCGKGRLTAGDFAKSGALRCYSGKAVYEKDICLSKLYPDERFYIEIDDAGATINVEINSVTAAVFTYKPFVADITDFVKNGENHIKLTVSNTLCNHYSTIPSKYSNFPEDSASGLIGPVRITVKTNED